MSSWLESMLRLSAPAAEAALAGMDGALRGLQRLLGEAVGLERNGRPRRAPLSGPADADAASAELANRWLRAVRRAGLEPAALPELWQETVRAASASLPLRDPCRLLELPLSLATLATQEGLRALTTAQTVPARLWPDFLSFVVEIFSDLHVYFSLQYREELDYWRRRVERRADDARARLELGRTLVKCGLFEEAAAELERAAAHRATRRSALYEGAVARYRSGDFAGAVRDAAACMRLDPGRERTRYWLWLAARAAGGYPAEVPAAHRMEAVAGQAPTGLSLEEVAAEVGLDKTSGGRGTAVFDFDGDGYLDVVVAGAHAGCSLYRNNRDGTFTDVSTGSGLDECVYGFGVAVGDYDNDGRPDLFVTSLGFFDGESALYRNNADGTFTNVTREAGLGCWGPGFTAAWVDYDGDGWLDLFVANNLGGLFDRKTPNRLFHNNGDGTFTEVTREAGLETPWPTIGAAWGDFRNDGRPDLFLSGLGRAQLYRNNGDGTFTDVSREAGIDAPAIGSVALVCDIDDDGWLDIVQFTYSRPDDAIFTLRHGHGPSDGAPPRIFRNNRDGTFTEIGSEMGVSGCWGTMSANAGDVGNDGGLDLFLGNGDPSMDRTEASVLLEGDGRSFRDVTFSAGLPVTGKGHGINLADLAGDGRLHLIVASGGLYPGDLQTTAVYRPRRRTGNYLNVRLVGTESNRDAIGARLALEAGGRRQHRHVSGGSNFGCLPFEQHFGLGSLTRVGALDIRWPTGHVQRLESLPVNTTIRITEGQAGWERVYRRR